MKALIIAPPRRAAIFAAALASAILLCATARPVFADGQRVMAVPELHALTPEAYDDAFRLTTALRDRFRALPSLRVVDGPPAPKGVPGYPNNLPPFELWRDAHVDIVLVGNTSIHADGRHWLSLRVWDVQKRTQLTGQMYVFADLQEQEHEIADLVRDAVISSLQQDAAPEQR